MPVIQRKPWTPAHQRVELGGDWYVILAQSEFDRLCRSAHLAIQREPVPSELGLASLLGDRQVLVERLIRRRRLAGLTQAALARRARIRPETLNRIERGRTTPDVATLRKLVAALEATRNGPSGRGR